MNEKPVFDVSLTFCCFQTGHGSAVGDARHAARLLERDTRPGAVHRRL